MSNDTPMRLALLGCGYAARLHSKTLGSFKRDITRYYASREVGKAKEFAARHGGAGWFGSYDDAIDSPDIDVVAVLTPPNTHLALAVRAMEAGKDVILEKPPVMRAVDFDELEHVAASTGQRVFVAENYYYKPLALRLRELLAADVIGEVLFVHLNAIKHQTTGDWRDDAEQSGPGALFEGGIHWVNFLANLGLPVRAVRGLRPGDGQGVERSMLVTFDYEGGAVGTLAYSWEVPSTLKGLRLSKIYGRKGALTFETNGLFLFVHGSETRLTFPGFRDIAGYKAMFRDFLRAWRTGEQPQMTLAKARHDLELIESAYLTAGTKESQ